MNQENFYTVRGYQLLNEKNTLLTSSMEDYLEMIYRVCLEEGFVRINELASKLNVRPSSTTKIVQKLERLRYVNYEKYGVIKLTKEGETLGAFLLKRHMILEDFLSNLGVEDTLKDTEMIEHDVSLSTLINIQLLNRFFSDNPDILKFYDAYKEQWNAEQPNALL
ncbi:iron dependent repressor, metal binding and dimerization domain protein [Clostridium aminobutyricum]|uniref:Manganese transport regulator n=1 Tax=Clostridium aminobutyricum TaxID=33953 RepID=A0A939D990_CLOAM|nr:iron dependent repressor, metal binding and dimerization domain protein [Clostridium aminobutyricum]MBN7773435.1 DtxR family transcriptional regulator [Clostridium aminobutyricum]